MSAFNLLKAKAVCPTCQKVGEFEIQFKYGNTWQKQYALGEVLQWGGNDVGRPGAKRTLIEGIGGPCVHCHSDNLDFYIVAHLDRLIDAVPLGEGQDANPQGYVIIE